MLGQNLKLFFRLYRHPRSTMAMIVDEGSFGFSGLAVLAATFLLASGPGALAHRDGPVAPTEQAETAMAVEPPRPSPMPVGLDQSIVALAAVMSGLGSVTLVAGLIVLYIPALIFVMSVADARTGTFGIALTRDYGSIAPCILMSVAAAELLVGGGTAVALLVAYWTDSIGAAILLFLAVVALGILFYVVLAWLAVRTVWRARGIVAFVAVILPFVILPLSGFLWVLASPFFLYLLYIWTRGDVTAIQWAIGSRRAFKRHMEACTLNPRDADAHYQLGLIHHHRRQYPEAVARFQKAVEIDPNEIDAHFQLGRIAREEGRHAEAIRHLEQVVARDPKYARHEIWREVGATYFDAGDFSNARTMLERYVENRPYDAEGLCLLGLSLKKLGETAAAAEMLGRCVEAAKTAPVYRRGELRRWRKQAEAEL